MIDEAGMADTLATVIDLAVARGASVRLIGDDRQLAAIGAGGVLRDIAATHGVVRLDELVRFCDPAEGETSLALRDGDRAALGYYLDNDRVHVGEVESCLDEVFAAWEQERAGGRDCLMLAPTRELVRELNLRVQSSRDGAGASVGLADGCRAHRGDVVMSRLNDRRLGARGTDWVKSGDRRIVTGVRADGDLSVRHATSRLHTTCLLPPCCKAPLHGKRLPSHLRLLSCVPTPTTRHPDRSPGSLASPPTSPHILGGVRIWLPGRAERPRFLPTLRLTRSCRRGWSDSTAMSSPRRCAENWRWRASAGVAGAERSMAGLVPHDEREAAYHRNLTKRINARYGEAINLCADRILEYVGKRDEQTAELAKYLDQLARKGRQRRTGPRPRRRSKAIAGRPPDFGAGLPGEGPRHGEEAKARAGRPFPTLSPA